MSNPQNLNPTQQDIDKWVQIIDKYKKEFNLNNREISRLSADMSKKYVKTREELKQKIDKELENKYSNEDPIVINYIDSVIATAGADAISGAGTDAISGAGSAGAAAGVGAGAAIGTFVTGGALGLIGLGVAIGGASLGWFGLRKKLSNEKFQSILVDEFSTEMKKELEDYRSSKEKKK